jgi:hypothetical protein
VNKRALENPGHDLHVPVGVRLETGAGQDDIVVVDEKEPEVGVAPVVVGTEGEGMM